MTTIEKKILPEYFEAILTGKKNFELRLGDFTVNEGDTLRLLEYENGQPTGRSLEKTVSYILKFHPDKLFWTAEEVAEHGFQILSLKD